MRKAIVGAVLVALVAGAVAAPAQAAKELKLFLRWDSDGAGGCGPTYLSTEDLPDEGNGCAFIFQPAQEAFIAGGQGALVHEWAGGLKKAVTLNSGKVKGEFVVHAYAAAQATLEIELRASTSKGTETLGTFTSAAFNGALTTSTGEVPVSFEIAIPKKLIGAKVTGFHLATTFRGVSDQTWIELDAPAAFLAIPIK
jgi:hypothetical protein